jgi:integrase
VKLTKRVIDALEPGVMRRYVYDSALRGFGVVVLPSGRKTFFAQYRTAGGRRGTSRRVAIGAYGTFTVDEARARARELILSSWQGNDPVQARAAQRLAPTVTELGTLFLDDVRSRRKPSTATEYGRMWRKHITPAFGGRRVAEVTTAMVSSVHRQMHQTPYLANRVLALLGAFFSFAERQGVRPKSSNPAHEIEFYSEHARERFLTPAEVARLGAALIQAETVGILPAPNRRRRPAPTTTAKHRPKSADVPRIADPIALAAIRFLLLTGWREREALTLRWTDLDLERQIATLPDTKTGKSVRHIGGPACQLLAGLPRIAGSLFVFPGRLPAAPRVEINRVWYAVRHAAELEDVRLHDLRHSFASAVASAGGSLLMIRALLGHKDASTSARYAHLLDEPVRLVADTTSASLSSLLSGGWKPRLVESS